MVDGTDGVAHHQNVEMIQTEHTLHRFSLGFHQRPETFRMRQSRPALDSTNIDKQLGKAGGACCSSPHGKTQRGEQ
ncbi:hypothetical protein M3J09_013034 [Ascochyta lentis]